MRGPLKGNKLIEHRLADIKQREIPAMCIMQISYICAVFSIHSQHIRNLQQHSQAFASIPKHLYHL